MIFKLLTEHHLEFLTLQGGCRGPSESTLVKMSNCWKSRALAQLFLFSSGALFASIGSVETLCSLLGTLTNNIVYAATLTIMNGFVFLVCAGCNFFAVIFLL